MDDCNGIRVDAYGLMEEKVKVLVIGNDKICCKLFREILNSIGYETMEAGHGAEGLKVAREYQPDMIIVDSETPETNVAGEIKLLKTDPATKHIPVISSLDYAASSAHHKSVKDCADNCITKPIALTEFLSAVRDTLNQRI